MSSIEQTFIGVWDNRDQNGNKSDTGGILFDKYDDLIFFLKVLNDNDRRYVNKKIHVYPNEVEKLKFSVPKDLDGISRKKELANILSKYIFLFKIKTDENDIDNIYAIQIESIVRNVDFDIDDTYEMIPIFGEDDSTVNRDISTFEKALSQGRAIIHHNMSWLDSDPDRISSFALFQGREQLGNGDLGTLYEYLTPEEVSDSYIKYQAPTGDDQINVRNLDTSKWANGIYPKEGNFVFVPKRYLLLEQNLDDVAPLKKSLVQDTNIRNDEENLLESFEQVVNSREYNLTFAESDLVNFHNSLKNNLLTILTGLSGTGKSKIVTAYSEALGILHAAEERQFNMISVRPFWQDDSDLLGFVDTMSNNYHPGDSGLVDTLISASKAANLDKLYIIVFDEMNLARVEHYFSQFLSVLEKSPQDRYITLYNKSDGKRLYNSDKYPYRIFISPNVRFVGTMNIDESTFQLSDKLLDRANIITLKMLPFTERKPLQTKKSLKQSSFSEISYDKYHRMANSTGTLSADELAFLWKLNEAINGVLPNTGIGWRTLESIERFLSNIPGYGNYTRRKALDYQISQRVFPKVRGTQDMLKELIAEDESGNLIGKLNDVLKEYQSLSDFDMAVSILKSKSLELKVSGFAR